MRQTQAQLRPLCNACKAVGRAALALLMLSSVDLAAFAQQPKLVSVGVVTAERRPVSRSMDFVGRIDGIKKVDVRARVKGFLEHILFKEGDTVKAGAPLYSLEKGQFEAEVAQAQGAVERSKAALSLATLQRQRAEELLTRQAGTTVARDQAIAAEQQAQGSVMTDEANLALAKINLDYTNITSPIAGRIGKTAFTEGNVVGPDSGPLTTIVSQDPMYVTFPVSQREFLRVQASDDRVDLKNIAVKLRFSDGRIYDQVGRVNFVDVAVDRATDSITLRATVPNPAGVLVDGQLVRVLLEAGTPEEGVVVPQAALLADQEGVYVFVIEDGKAVTKRIKIGDKVGSSIVVKEGLQGGEQVVLQGLQSLKPGVGVSASVVEQPPGAK